MRILGIDPALNKTGWGIIELSADNNSELKFIACGIINIVSRETMFNKLKILYQDFSKIIQQYQPCEVSIEETFVNKNALSSLKLGHARGAIITSCVNQNLPIYEYGANKIKKTVCGAGKAEKEQVAMMVKILLPKAEFSYNDESDALAAAICHSQYRKFANI